jgi:D-amino peptidase
LCLLLSGGVAAAQGKKRVFIITDAEGVAGVCRQELTEPASAELRQLLTGEVNAAVEGFLEGGADEVTVWDGHDGSQTLSALTIHPRAVLISGSLGAAMLLDRGYSAVAFLGQHARANRRPAVMAHSYSSLGIQEMRMNGQPVGEIETRAALAGWFNVPVIFLSGDQAAAEDLKAIVPGAELVVVKEALSYYACISQSAQTAREMIRAGAKRAIAKAPPPPYKLPGPVTIEVERTTRNTLGQDAGAAPGTQVLDARTLRYTGKDFYEAWTRYSAR